LARTPRSEPSNARISASPSSAPAASAGCARGWLDHLAVGKPCALATAREARDTLEVTLAIEHSTASGKPVVLPLAG
jgi:hypothetical protein